MASDAYGSATVQIAIGWVGDSHRKPSALLLLLQPRPEHIPTPGSTTTWHVSGREVPSELPLCPVRTLGWGHAAARCGAGHIATSHKTPSLQGLTGVAGVLQDAGDDDSVGPVAVGCEGDAAAVR